jgi:hypothetical protein
MVAAKNSYESQSSWSQKYMCKGLDKLLGKVSARHFETRLPSRRKHTYAPIHLSSYKKPIGSFARRRLTQSSLPPALDPFSLSLSLSLSLPSLLFIRAATAAARSKIVRFVALIIVITMLRRPVYAASSPLVCLPYPTCSIDFKKERGRDKVIE